MFEYTALVDAPVRRFTSIVTDPEPDEAPIVVAVVTTASPIAVPVLEAPVLIVPVDVESSEAAAAAQLAPTAPRSIEPPLPIERPIPVATRFVPRPEPAKTPSLVPALIGIAAAGITAFLWMRRDGHGATHDRGR